MSSQKQPNGETIITNIPDALEHFKLHEPCLGQALLTAIQSSRPITLPSPKPSKEYRRQLYGSIISQQISVKAAAAIEARFIKLVENVDDSHAILTLAEEDMKSIGLSRQKASYIKSIAEHETNGSVDFEHLDTLSDEEVVQELTKIKGVGRWTAEMFLIFTLARPNVFGAGDLGLLRAAQKLFTMPTMTKEQLHERSVSWSPYRSVAALTLWHTLDNKPN